MTARRRLAAALLVPFGVVISHLISYSVAHSPGAGGADGVTAAHGHLGPLAMVAAVGVAAAVVVSGYAGATGRQLRLTPLSLAGAQGAAFASMELGEHLTHGSSLGDALREPTLWVGLAVQLAVAALSCLLLRASEAVGRRLAARPSQRWPRRVVLQLMGFPVGAVRPIPSTSLSRRGPPLVFDPIL